MISLHSSDELAIFRKTFPHLITAFASMAAYFNILLHTSFPAFFRYLNMAHDMDLAPSQMWFCKAIAAVLFTSSMCSTLFILSMTFERCYSIIRPHKAASFNTVKRAKVSIVFIILFSIGYNSPLWLLSSQVIGKSRNCYAYANAMSSIPGQIYYWSANILQFILPFLFLLMMNTVIIYTLSNRSKFRAEYQGQGQSPGHGQGQVPCQIQKVKTSEKQIFVMLLLVTFSYLILNTPTYLLVFLNFTNIKKQTAHSLALFHLLYSVAQKALYTNYGINFLLYVMSGQKFRKDLILLLKNMLNLITCGREVREQSTPDTSVFNTSSSVH